MVYPPLMTSNPHSILDALMSHLTALTEERERLVARVTEIDTALAKAAKQLGLDPSIAEGVSRLAKPAAPPDTSTMGGALVQFLLNADKGISRHEARAELGNNAKFKAQMDNNMNAFYNTVSRYVKKGAVVDIDGLLYHPERAPLPEGEEDPTGQHLSNVATLFGPQREGQSHA